MHSGYQEDAERARLPKQQHDCAASFDWGAGESERVNRTCYFGGKGLSEGAY